jgi:beta-N-acetylhexosaminidase
MRSRQRLLGLALVVGLITGTAVGAGPAAAVSPAPKTTNRPATGAAVASTGISPQAELNRMTFRQRVGQLLMVGTPASHGSHAAATAIKKYHVGSLILVGNSERSLAWNKKRDRKAQKLATEKATASSPLYIAADQEGGYIRNLRGKGFSHPPTALTQGTWSDATIKRRATVWGKQLKRAGLNLNLAPVMGTVPKSLGRKNKPIGFYYREYGHTPHRVEMKGTAFANGMRAAGMQTAIKHFPGLGEVRGNTDTTANVHDNVTTRHGSTVKPFKTGIKAGAQFVMISSAFYDKIDKKPHRHRGVFSKKIMHTMLRGDLGFKGVVISDDLGQAKQVANVKVGRRAIDFVKAGGNMILTVKPEQAKTMTHALVAEANRSAAFKKKVNTSALKVLEAKHRAGLNPPKPKHRSVPPANRRGILRSDTTSDFNGDGKSDLFYVTKKHNQLIRYEGTPPWHTVSHSMANPGHIFIGDFNGDHKSDLFYVDSHHNWLIRYGGKPPWHKVAHSTANPERMFVGDFNGDGKSDIFYVQKSHNWVIRYGARPGWRKVAHSTANPERMFVGDFNGDGKSDIFYVTEKHDHLIRYGGTPPWHKISHSNANPKRLLVR